MVIFLFGPDSFRAQKKLREIINHYKEIYKNAINLKIFDEENFNFQELNSFLNLVAIFKERKLLILKNLFSNSEFREGFFKQKEKFVNSKEIIVIFEGKEISKEDHLFQFLLENSKWQEFKFLENEKLKNWAKREILNYNLKITSEALEKLLEFVGNDLWQLDNEIKKLSSYKRGEKIEVKDIELLVRPKIEVEIFRTIDAIAEKKKKTAFYSLHCHLKRGDHPLYLLSMIKFQFRNLLIVKDLIERKKPYYQILKESKLHPLIIKKCYFECQKFTKEELKKIYQKIFHLELNIKTGKIEPETALELLISTL